MLMAASLVKRIQARIATILCHLPNRKQAAKALPRIKESLDSLIAMSSHVCVETAGSISCARCRNSFSRTNVQVCRDWILSPCKAIGSAVDAPTPVVYGVHLGTQNAHHTHNLFVYHGVIFCHKCGAMTSGQLLNHLARPCAPPTEWGRRNLAALSAGKLPPKLKEWPAPSTLYQGLSPEESRILDNLNRQIDEFKLPQAASSTDKETPQNPEQIPRHYLDDPDFDPDMGSDSSSD